ncbi:uncharacterized protein BP5553_03903 [Venustampulla echinocandica]|uniref:Kinesin-like protein n=1 Tax=Venustampulla echinocandica TaxID=2656787 RepID=A0A370TVK7_9HELO|nr:uncharacterized protein BP5553_03903 [Venustampulla echinocandica]RDL39563.1 hypothetical protein BP5553_03903 [Venustampulla echinocandica]
MSHSDPDAGNTRPITSNAAMAPTASQGNSALQMFRPFQALVGELRIQLYNHCLSPRVVRITEVGIPISVQGMDPAGMPITVMAYTSRMEVIGASMPSLFHAIPEAKHSLIKAGRYRALLTMHGTSHAVYFNSDLDTTRLERNQTPLSPSISSAQIRPVGHPQSPPAQKVAVNEAHCIIHRPAQTREHIYPQSLLRGEDRHFPPILNPDGEIEVEGEQRQSIVPKYNEDGVAHYGHEAMRRVFQNIEDPDEQQGLMALLADLEQIDAFAMNVRGYRVSPSLGHEQNGGPVPWDVYNKDADKSETLNPRVRPSSQVNTDTGGEALDFMYANLQQRFRDTVLDINEILIDMALEPRLMPSVAAEMRSVRSSASTPSLRSREGSVMRIDAPGGNVRVVVRVRGFLPREMERGAECLIEMNPVNQATTLLVPNDTDPANTRSKTRKVIEEKAFTFDNSFWSHNKADEHYAHQEDVYNSLGEEFLDHNFEGYHTCIFAYGQTGSGKSYTMMGTPDQPGLIPRTCEDLFQRIEAAHNETPDISYNVRVSYFEVYNEHVRDLLVPVQPNQPPYYLKIRESPTEGPYIKDLTDAPVKNISEIMRYMKMGDASRTTASTKMNDTSSRSHSVFTIMLKQIHHDMETDETTERTARIRLVDLAGSERAKATEATGARLREGSNINKSLTTLGRVIAALADPKQQRPGKRSKDVVPYRDSILTWLLKDSLGGNSKTAMIACIAPSDYDETLSTLRYADQAKRIRTRAVVNQDHVSAAERDAQIAAMAEEIRVLQLSVSDNRRREKEGKEQEEKLEEYQNRVIMMQRMMEERSMVAEGKIRNLQTENDALRLHLKLALDSLKNPIEVRSARNSVQGGATRGSISESHERDPIGNDAENGNDDRTEVPESEYYDEDEGIDVAVHEEKANEVQGFMKELLQDLNMFKKKIGDDKLRFVTASKAFGARLV